MLFLPLKAQFYDGKNEGPQTPISSLNFLDSVESRAKNMGRLIFKDAAEDLLQIDNWG